MRRARYSEVTSMPADSSALPLPPRWSVRALVVAWTVPVLLGLPVTLLGLRTGEYSVPIWRVLLMVGATWYVWALMTPIVVRLAERHRLERPLTARVIALHFGAALAACAVQALTTASISQLLAPGPDTTVASLTVYWFMLLTPAGVIVYAGVVGLRIAQVNRAEARERERQAQQLAAQLSEAQLTALRAQIQPHFLFNTLNAVIALVRDRQNDEAAEALTTLSTLLRTALRTGATHEVALADELAFTTNYLAIERLRFGDRLHVGIDVPPALGDARVPSFLLQPFVENALRHGLRHQPTGGRVDISVHAINGGATERLVVRVEDDGAGLAPDWEERTAAGFGIANSRARLAQLYGRDARVTIARREDVSRTLVEIELPLRTNGARA